MPIAILSLVIPAQGDGPPLDISALTGKKTIVLSGLFRGIYTLLGSHDDINFDPILSFNASGPEGIKQTFNGAFKSVRMRSQVSFTQNVVGSLSAELEPGLSQFVSFPLLAAFSYGPQTAIDLFSLVPPTGLVSATNIICKGNFTGTVSIEGSLDGVRFQPFGAFQGSKQESNLGLQPGILEFSPLEYTDQVRYLRANVCQGCFVSVDTVLTVGGEIVPSSGIGMQGDQGNQGPGNQGGQGNQGPGNQGNQGPGNQGEQGSQGPGNQGNQGPGNQGNQGDGSQGNQGPGNQGGQGNQGYGQQGNQGASARSNLVSNETEFLATVASMNVAGGGAILLTGLVTLTADRTVNLDNIYIQGGSLLTGISFNGYKLINTGSYDCRNVGFFGTTPDPSGAPGEICFAAAEGGPGKVFRRWSFENCAFREMVGGTSAGSCIDLSGLNGGTYPKILLVQFINPDVNSTLATSTNQLYGFIVDAGLTSPADGLASVYLVVSASSSGFYAGTSKYGMRRTAGSVGNAAIYMDGNSQIAEETNLSEPSIGTSLCPVAEVFTTGTRVTTKKIFGKIILADNTIAPASVQLPLAGLIKANDKGGRFEIARIGNQDLFLDVPSGVTLYWGSKSFTNLSIIFPANFILATLTVVDADTWIMRTSDVPGTFRVGDEAKFLEAVQYLAQFGGGNILLTGTITFTADRTVNLDNVRVQGESGSGDEGFVFGVPGSNDIPFVLTVDGREFVFADLSLYGTKSAPNGGGAVGPDSETLIKIANSLSEITISQTFNGCGFYNCVGLNRTVPVIDYSPCDGSGDVAVWLNLHRIDIETDGQSDADALAGLIIDAGAGGTTGSNNIVDMRVIANASNGSAVAGANRIGARSTNPMNAAVIQYDDSYSVVESTNFANVSLENTETVNVFSDDHVQTFADFGTLLHFTNGVSKNLTLSSDVTTDNIGNFFDVLRGGTGDVAIVIPASYTAYYRGLPLVGPSTITLTIPREQIKAQVVSATEWVISDASQGQQGNQGPGNQGNQGPGNQGNQGRVGGQGNQGPGNQGDQGNQGPGNQGNQGDGSQGHQGDIGGQGNQGPGNQGNQGEGSQGNQGPGNQGDQGNQGPGNQGNQGPGNQGLIGDQGNQGPGNQGDQGNQGPGNQGNQGDVGGQGNQGPGNQGDVGGQGNQGPGNQGDVGDQGNQGPGNQGEQGNQGPGNQGNQGPGNQGNQGPGVVPGPVAVVQARRTSTYSLTDSFVDLIFDTTDVETDPVSLEHDGTDKYKIICHSAGTYLFQWSIFITVTTGGIFDTKLRKNNAADVPGGVASLPIADGGASPIFGSVFLDAAANDVFTLQVKGSTGISANIEIGATIGADLLEGPSGSQGRIGGQGNQGNFGPQGTNPGADGNQGNQGEVGGQGNQGIGSQGNQGDLGGQGNQGPGNQGNQGPGSQGDQGNQGPGNQGNQGPGNQGLIGEQGNQGPGNQGNQGEGSQGEMGEQGNQGPGNQGDQGNQGPGNQGNQGPGNQGLIGGQGNQGPGNQGNQGAGNQGNQGPGNQGNQGLGNQGLIGEQGNQGPGNQGNQGEGSQGEMGEQGNQGPGNQGGQGNQGPGNQGNQGPGNQGNQGFAPDAASGFRYDANTLNQTDSDPGAAKLKWNNITQGSAVQLYVNDADKSTTDLSAFYSTLQPGDTMEIHSQNNVDQFQIFTITGVTDETGFFRFDVSLQVQEGSDFGNGADIVLTFGHRGSQGNQGNQGRVGGQGNQGPGNQGNQGPGNQGRQGNQGPGNQGNQGPGNQGGQGNQGPGNQGNQGPGNQGNQGNQGPGNQGNQGNQGPTFNVGTVTTTDATVTTAATIPIPDNTVVLITAWISARRTDVAARAGYERQALVYREAAGAATLQGTVDTPLTRESVGGWDCTITVSGNNALIRVTGAGGSNINWRVQYFTNEVS